MTTRRPRTASAARSLLAILLIAALAAGGWYAWVWRGGNAGGPRYRTEPVTRGRIASVINASGTVVPEEVVDVGAQVAGKIIKFEPDLDGKEVNYRSRVGKGQTLALIDDALYKSEVDIAEADVSLAEAEVARCKADLDGCRTRFEQSGRDLDRGRRLAKTSSIAAAELETIQQTYLTNQAAVTTAEATLKKAEASVSRAKTSFKRAKTTWDYTKIISPVDGVVIDRRVNIGQTVVSSLNAPSLFLIAKDLKRMEVWVSVNEADIGRVSISQEAAFRVDAFPNTTFKGRVEQVRLNASMTNNVVTYTVVVKVNNDDLKLLPYLTANLQFRVDARDDVLKVPNSALRYRPQGERVAPEYAKAYVDARQKKATSSEMVPGTVQESPEGRIWVERGGLLYPILVRMGLTDGNFTEVEPITDVPKDGPPNPELKEGDPIIVGEASGPTGGGGTSNPFAVKMFGGKKKDKE